MDRREVTVAAVAGLVVLVAAIGGVQLFTGGNDGSQASSDGTQFEPLGVTGSGTPPPSNGGVSGTATGTQARGGPPTPVTQSPGPGPGPATGTRTPAEVATPTGTPATPTPTARSTPLATPTPTRAPTPTRTPAPTPTTATPSPATETPTPDPATPTPGPATPEPESPVNRSELEAAVETEINDYRRERSVPALQSFGQTPTDLTAMLRDHTGDLEANGSVWTVPLEYDIAGLYERYDLYQDCQFIHNSHVVEPDGAKLLAVQRIDVSSGNVTAIAGRIVDNWLADPYDNGKFAYENATYVGVGVTVDAAADTAYVGMSLC